MPSRLGSPNKDRRLLHELLDKIGKENLFIQVRDARKGHRKASRKITRYEAMIRAGFEAATGIFREETALDGKTKLVFQSAPDAAAFRAVMEQRWGKAPQQVDVTSDGDPVPPPTYVITPFDKLVPAGENGNGQHKG